MAHTRPHGTLQVDVDDLWVYYESIGRPTPENAPPLAFSQGIPRLLDLFDRFGARGTFFVCGRDLPAQAAMVREIVRRGHEVANHSAAHRNGFARLGAAELRLDIAEAADRIAQAAGQVPVGFKAPGFSFNPGLPAVLEELGYLYDSSLLPSFFAPLLRLVQGVLSRGEVDPTHYGRAIYGLAPLSPYRLDPARPYRRLRGHSPGAVSREPRNGRLWEAPVTTMPFLRLPMHSTFVLSAGRWLFDLGLVLAKARGVPVNYLLHAADVVDSVADPALASYKFLRLDWGDKRPLYEHVLAELSASYQLVPTRELIDHHRAVEGQLATSSGVLRDPRA